MRTQIFVAAALLLPLAVAATGAAHYAPLTCPANNRVVSYGGAFYIHYVGPAPLAGLVPSPPTNVVNSFWYAESGAEPGLQIGDGHAVLDNVIYANTGLDTPVTPWGHEHICQAAGNYDFELY